VLAGVCLTLAALLAAVGAASIGLRISLTSDGSVQPLLSGDHAAATEAVATAVAGEVEDAHGTELPNEELVAAITEVIDDDVANGADQSKWHRSVEQAHHDTLAVSESGDGESTMDVEWIVDALFARQLVTIDGTDIRPLLIVSDERAPMLHTVRSALALAAVALPLVAMMLAVSGLALSRRDRLRSLRVFALAAAGTSVVLGIVIATVPRAIVTGMAPDAAKDLAGKVVGAVTRPTLISVGVLCAIELALFGIGHLAVRRRRRQAKPASEAVAA
jgi:hypothetical protein